MGSESILKSYTGRIKTTTFPTTNIYYENPLLIALYPSVIFQIDGINYVETTKRTKPISYNVSVMVVEKLADVSVDQMTGQQIMTAKTTCENKFWTMLSDMNLPYTLIGDIAIFEGDNNNKFVAVLTATMVMFE